MLPRIAAIMPDRLIEGAERGRIVRYQQNQTAPRLEHRANQLQRTGIIVDVLEDIEANDRIHLSFERAVVLRLVCVKSVDMHCGAMLERVRELLEILGLDIGCDVVTSAWAELAGHVADACANFEHRSSHIRRNSAGHPTIEPASLRDRTEERRGGVRVQLAGEAPTQNHPGRVERVSQTDFFPLFVCAAVVADGRFINPSLASGEFDRELGIHTNRSLWMGMDFASEVRNAL